MNLTAVAKEAVKRIENDIMGRSGIGNEMDAIDEDIRREMFEEWKNIIEEEITEEMKRNKRTQKPIDNNYDSTEYT